jgi:hypothetical protein
VLRLPWDYGLVPLASLLALCARALYWAARALLVGLLWASLVLLVDLVLLRPLRLVRRVPHALREATATLVAALVPAYEDARALRSAVARLEKRLKRTEQHLKQQNKALQQLQQQQQRGHHQLPSSPSHGTPLPLCCLAPQAQPALTIGTVLAHNIAFIPSVPLRQTNGDMSRRRRPASSSSRACG